MMKNDDITRQLVVMGLKHSVATSTAFGRIYGFLTISLNHTAFIRLLTTYTVFYGFSIKSCKILLFCGLLFPVKKGNTILILSVSVCPFVPTHRQHF